VNSGILKLRTGGRKGSTYSTGEILEQVPAMRRKSAPPKEGMGRHFCRTKVQRKECWTKFRRREVKIPEEENHEKEIGTFSSGKRSVSTWRGDGTHFRSHERYEISGGQGGKH